MNPSLSAILIATDEETSLPACLESLRGLVDEIVVVIDPATRDRTEEVARAAGAKILRRPFDDYAAQRQASLEMATGQWCLWIDPDETLSPELRAEIKTSLASSRVDAYSLPFEVWFMGRRLRWGGLGSERHVRLFRAGRARFTGGLLHERLDVSGLSGGLLSGTIRHEPYRDLREYLEKLDRYTTLAARKRRDQGQRFSAWRHLVLPWEFFSRSVLKLGVLDGHAGLVWAGLAAFHSWLKYVKLREMELSEERP
ncbi:MAG TPA: hypothetical protein DCP85_12835 [Elusimicrobia bacterium]|nr:hypothetical protein [Elusimicrobiota bacterium]